MVIELTKQQYLDALNLSNGSYYPQKGFVNFLDFDSITKNFFDTKKQLCSFPIYLDVNEETKNKLKKNSVINLSYKNKKIFTLKITSIFKIDKSKYLKKLFETTNMNH